MVTTNEDIIESQNICENFLSAVADSRESTAIRVPQPDGTLETVSYTELADRVARAVTGLATHGVTQGDYVLLMMTNRIEFHIADLACLFLRATPVSVYNSSSVDQVVEIISQTKAKVAIVEDQFGPTIVEARQQSATLSSIVSVGESFEGSDASFDELVGSNAADLEDLASKVEGSDIATVIFTSGTTGESKGVVLDHDNLTWTVACLRRTLNLDTYKGQRLISYLPMAHVAERTVSHYTGLISGFDITCCPEPTQVAEFAKTVRPTILFGVPRVYEKIYNKVLANLCGENPTTVSKLVGAVKFKLFKKKILDKVGLNELVVAASGGAALSPTVMEWFTELGLPISEIYGLSETCGPLAWAPFDAKAGRVGPACPGIEMRLAEDGEIQCRGGNVFRGYLNRQDLTDQVLDAQGWFSTGDIGVVDGNGSLKVIDRKKEILVTSGGKNVSPTALENALKLIPVVSQAAVVGDGRKFVSSLVTLDPDAAHSWCEANGIKVNSMAEVASCPEFNEALDTQVETAMGQFSHAEQVKKVHLLDHDWEPDTACLTATSKLRRRVIEKTYASEIEAMYS